MPYRRRRYQANKQIAQNVSATATKMVTMTLSGRSKTGALFTVSHTHCDLHRRSTESQERLSIPCFFIMQLAGQRQAADVFRPVSALRPSVYGSRGSFTERAPSV